MFGRAIAAGLLIAPATLAAASAVQVGKFTDKGPPPAPWHLVKTGKIKPTEYHVATVANVVALEAHVDNSMAMLARPIAVDLAQTPVLCWSWYIDGVATNADMRKRSGDDYAARIYIAFDMPDSALGAGTKMKLAFARKFYGIAVPDAAVIYVWDNRNPVGTARRSSYTDRLQLVVAESGGAHAGKWVTERADVAADFARAFGGKPGKPVQLAVAADGDNTKRKGMAAFANISFVSRDQKCAT
jgi:hypothetical protein